jgi:hypothetical protein
VRPDVLQRARQLEDLLERVARCTPPDSLDRANLVSRLEKLVRWFEEPDRRRARLLQQISLDFGPPGA